MKPVSALSQKVGQVFMVGFEGAEVTPDLSDWMRQFGWGGVILFGRNVVSPAQLTTLTQGLQAIAQDEWAQPLLIATDQEGGRVCRLPGPFTPFPSAALVGQTGSEEIAFEVGAAIGRELSAVGINMDMAPVLDVLLNAANTVIGDRAFGHDPVHVARLGAALMRGLHAQGVLAVGKHFPGHGATLLDSHVTQPVAERTASQLEACELVPFREALAAGLQAIMTAHVVYPAWDARRPATLSPTIITGILRERMAFQGVIITDDLGMAGVADALPWEAIAVQALRAGADMLLICHHRQRQEHAYLQVIKAVQEGLVPAALIDRAAARVQNIKGQLARLRHATMAPAPLEDIGSAAHRRLTEQVRHWARDHTRVEASHDA